MEKIRAIKNSDKLCWKCLKEQEGIHTLEFGPLGYGSGFDCCSTKIQLCDACYNESIPEIWSKKLVYDSAEDEEYDWCHYEHEDKIFQYFDTLPLEGQQFVWNEFWQGDHYMEAQDWIDYHMGILPHEKAKEYGLYSTQEIKAYEERFPKCKWPANRLYNDNSRGCWCPFGAHGDYNQEISTNISDECYLCKHYEERKKDEKIKEIKDEDFSDYKILVLAKAVRDKLSNRDPIEVLLFTNYGTSSIPEDLLQAAEENPEGVIRNRTGAVISKLKEIRYEIEGLTGFTEETLKKLILEKGIIYSKQDHLYFYMKEGDTHFTQMKIEQVNTNRKWILHEYDGAESIQYIEVIDESIGLCWLT